MKILAHILPAVVGILVTGCVLRDTHAEQSARASAQVGIVNHTGKYIYFATVDGAGGGNMARWGAGGADVCCASIPRVWYPGMKVLVRWDMPEGLKHVVKEKVVDVEKYDRLGDIYLNFFDNDEVRVVVSRNDPRSSDFPIRHFGNPNEASSSN
jgi:hypothetical protein